MKVTLKGAAAMARKIRQTMTEFPNRVERALYQEAQIEMTEAKRRTPVWNPARPLPRGVVPGALRASGQVQEPERDGNNISVTLTFGDANVDYAVYVHEDLEAFHATGQAKYLESVLDESASSMAERLARRIHLDNGET